jgi:glycosyltransferase involved in cell wall biosynthesis
MIHSGIADEEPPPIDRTMVRAEFGVAADAPMMIYVGRLAAQKGVDDLIRAVDLLQHVNPDLRALIVGDGPLRMHLEDVSHAFQLNSMVRFLGHRDDVPKLLAASDLLVLPSLYEGLPNVVLEAMRFRKAVVATSAPGTTELVTDGETGLLVPPQNPPALAEAIRNVLDDPALSRRLGEGGRARVESHFRAETMVAHYAELYEQLAGAKGRGV